jgi:TonB family protein
MIRVRVFTVSILAVLVYLACSQIGLAQKPCPFRAPVGEDGLRKYKTTRKVKPLYPAESLKNQVSGKVIVDILIDENGKVAEVKVQQSPDALTGQAVVDAAKQWEFQPPPKVEGRQICYSSTLGFRFAIEHGKGKVLDSPAN